MGLIREELGYGSRLKRPAIHPTRRVVKPSNTVIPRATQMIGGGGVWGGEMPPKILSLSSVTKHRETVVAVIEKTGLPCLSRRIKNKARV